MMPLEPKDDGLNAARGMLNAVFVCLVGWAVILFIVALCYGCSSDSEAQIKSRLKIMEVEVGQHAGIRQQALQKVNEQFALGELVARYNKTLTLGEVYLIGRAIEINADRHGIDPVLLAALIVNESHGKARAVSAKGAVGVMQVMPYWLDELGIGGDLYDVETNVNVGAFILADNIRRWGMDEGIRRYLRGGKSGGRRYLANVKAVMTQMRREKDA